MYNSVRGSGATHADAGWPFGCSCVVAKCLHAGRVGSGAFRRSTRHSRRASGAAYPPRVDATGRETGSAATHPEPYPPPRPHSRGRVPAGSRRGSAPSRPRRRAWAVRRPRVGDEDVHRTELRLCPSISPWMSATRLASAGSASARPPAQRMRSAVSSAPTRSMSPTTTAAPAVANASASARPIPDAAPVTTVTPSSIVTVFTLPA